MNSFKLPKRIGLWTIAASLLGSCLLPEGVLAQEGRVRIETIIHLHSRYSFVGKLTFEEILKQAKDKGINALIFTDHALVKISYGFFPFRRLLKISVQEGSVFKKGLHRYFKELEELNRKYPELLTIPALEVAPFYYWETPPISSRGIGHGIIRDWNKHLLVMGLDEREFRTLPLIENRPVPLKPFQPSDLLKGWGLLLIAVGFLCFRKRIFDYRDETGKNLAPPSPLFRAIGWILVVIGMVSLVENYPYRRQAFDIYSPSEKILPYQNLIDDVQKKGGLVFWAHPEGKTIPYHFGPVTFLTDPYPEALVETKDYTGFAIFFEGFKTIGPPGGIWDRLLLEYCRGERQRPVWAIGELDYIEEWGAGKEIDTVKTIVFAKEKDQKSFLGALGEGRMVAARHSPGGEITFGHFWVEDPTTGRRAEMGEELSIETSAKIVMSLSSKGSVSPVRVRLIKGGEVIQEWEAVLPMEKVYEDLDVKGFRSFYRLEAQSVEESHKLITNPIFVSRKR